MRTEFLCISVLRVASGPRVASCSALNPCLSPTPPPSPSPSAVVYSTDRSKAVVPVSLCCFVVDSTRRFILYLTLYFVLVFFSPFSIAITSLGKRELILVLFVRLFDLRLFGFVCFLFFLVSGKGCGL